jgi:hypothetical protein
MAAANSQLMLVHRALMDHVTGSTSVFDTVLEAQRTTMLRVRKSFTNAARENDSATCTSSGRHRMTLTWVKA